MTDVEPRVVVRGESATQDYTVTGVYSDGRRATIAAKYCVVAMGGDQLGDFSDLFNAGLAPTKAAICTTNHTLRFWIAGDTAPKLASTGT